MFRFLLLLLCFAKANNVPDVRTELEDDSSWNSWVLDNVGGFAINILNAIVGPENGVIKETLSSSTTGFLYPFLGKSMEMALEKQNNVLVAVIIGAMVTVLTIFAMCIIHICKSNFKSHVYRPRVEISTSSFQLREKHCLIIIISLLSSIILVIAGSVALLIASDHLHDVNLKAFQTAQTIVRGLFQFKKSFDNTLKEMPFELVKVITDNTESLSNYNQQLRSKFEDTTGPYRLPLLNAANAIDHYVHVFLQDENAQNELKAKIQERTLNLKRMVNRFRDVMGVMRKLTAREITEGNSDLMSIDTLLGIPDGISAPKFNESHLNKEYGVLRRNERNPIFNYVFETASRLLNASSQVQIDPTHISNQMKRIGYRLVEKNKGQVKALTSEISNLLPATSEEYTMANLNDHYIKATFLIHVIHPICVSVAVVGLCLILPLALGVAMGLFGTKWLGICGSKGYRKTVFSHRGSKVIEGQLYVSSCFLWVFWFLAVILFIISVIPMDVCMSLKDKGVANFKIGEVFHRAKMNGTAKANMKNVLTDCQHSKTFTDSLGLERLFDVLDTEFDTLKSDFSYDTIGMKEMIRSIPLINESKISDFYSVTRHLRKTKQRQASKLQALSQDLSSFSNNLKETFCNKIKELKRSSNLVPLLQQNLRKIRHTFDEIETNASIASRISEQLRKGVVEGDELLYNLNRNTFDLLTATKKVNKFIEEQAEKALTKDVRDVADNNVNGWKFALKYWMVEQKRRKTNCEALSSLYAKVEGITCRKYLNVIALAWLGESLLAAFLLCSMLLAIPTIGFFQFKPAVTPKAPSKVNEGIGPPTSKFRNLRRDTFDLAMMSDGGAQLKSGGKDKGMKAMLEALPSEIESDDEFQSFNSKDSTSITSKESNLEKDATQKDDKDISKQYVTDVGDTEKQTSDQVEIKKDSTSTSAPSKPRDEEVSSPAAPSKTSSEKVSSVTPSKIPVKEVSKSPAEKDSFHATPSKHPVEEVYTAAPSVSTAEEVSTPVSKTEIPKKSHVRKARNKVKSQEIQYDESIYEVHEATEGTGRQSAFSATADALRQKRMMKRKKSNKSNSDDANSTETSDEQNGKEEKRP